MQLNASAIIITAIGLLFLGACGSNQATAPASPVASTPVEPQPSAVVSPAAKTSSAQASNGGQVVEVGPYHLEFVPEKEGDTVHLDFFLQNGDSHEAIPDAKVAAQVQLPDGTQQSLDMTYDAGDKHYTALLPATATGEYKVAVLSDIGGEKVNGRFTFTK